MNIAYVFPGQGAQQVGMGKDIAALPVARHVFDEADALLDFSLSRLMFDGPKDALDDTLNTQPALFTVGVALLELMPQLTPAFVAGHSLGEYTALYAAGALTFSDGLRLVRERGRLMKQAGEQEPGSMAALIGLDDQVVNAICDSIGNVQVANYNSPGQVVISGKREAVAAAMQAAKEHKAKLVTPLDVSIASHSALMKPMVDAFARVIHDTPLRPPQIPVVGNLNALPLENIESVRDELIRQPVASVRWTQSVEYMAAAGVDTFVEIGPGRVLSGLIKRIVKGARLFNVSDAASLQPALSQEQA